MMAQAGLGDEDHIRWGMSMDTFLDYLEALTAQRMEARKQADQAQVDQERMINRAKARGEVNAMVGRR